MTNAVSNNMVSHNHELSDHEKTELTKILLSKEFSDEEHIYKATLTSSRTISKEICIVSINDYILTIQRIIDILNSFEDLRHFTTNINSELSKITSYDGYTRFIEMFRNDLNDIENTSVRFIEIKTKIEQLEASQQEYCVFSVKRVLILKEIKQSLVKILDSIPISLRVKLRKYPEISEFLKIEEN